ncbi:MAG: 3-phosphoshikimate 1-carboxyvinyltransferase [Proteobacteria bacterium]|nr:3-phosphoshikimate 1-carboxyvinyltransferase [Pseudomonadota bacterium]
MELPQILEIPCSKSVDGRIRIPGSKSISNRAILIASLAQGTSWLDGVLASDDTFYMMKAWKNLGAEFVESDDGIRVQGCGGRLSACRDEIYIENAGTAARFLTAALTLGSGRYVVTGNERMRQRPIVDLLNALNTLGGKVADIAGTGCPPVEITAGGLSGGTVRIPGDKSSQYISAIMLAAPYAGNRTVVEITGNLVSRSYVEMTIDIMRAFDVRCRWLDEQTLSIDPGQHYVGKRYSIEGDASSASYFLGMAAITQGRIKIKGVKSDSTQGDLGLLGILEEMGCRVVWEDDGVVLEGRPLKGIEVDMNTMSDVAPTLAVVALFAEGVTKIRNVGNMRIKECDRIQAVVAELRKLGADAEEWDTGLGVTGLGRYRSAELDTYGDHRMAMSLSLAGLKIPGVKIKNPQCVSKTFPTFYDMFLPLISPS